MSKQYGKSKMMKSSNKVGLTPIKNMHYFFYTTYFDGIEKFRDGSFVIPDNDERNRWIYEKEFDLSTSPLLAIKEGHPAYRSFHLQTQYPGLLMGTGYHHDISGREAIKIGFSFDYVSGLPYLPGSSLKGTLRSYFPQNEKDELKRDYIFSLLQEDDEVNHIDVEEIGDLRDLIFESGQDSFLGAYPYVESAGKKAALLAEDVITPHHQDALKHPIPLKLLKVRGGIGFEFAFLLKDSELRTGKVTAGAKERLFQKILLDMGIGAKTNVGYGKLAK